MKYFVFGDTGGHFNQLFNSLVEIGLTDDYKLPSDVHIIHMGDLVHKGLYSHDILTTVDQIRQKNPGQWTQMIGNHEAQYLGGHVFWNPSLDVHDQAILHQWFSDGFLNFIHALDKPLTTTLKNGDKYELTDPTIFSHAGVSFPFWNTFLKSTSLNDYNDVAASLNADDLHKAGYMLQEEFNMENPTGPMWSHGIHEVWLKWVSEFASPFNQFVGHINPYMFERGIFFPGTVDVFKSHAKIYESDRITVAPLGENPLMFFMAPGYSKVAYGNFQPYVLLED